LWFSHVDELSTGGIEVNRELLLTLSVLKPQIPPSAKIITELEPQLPAAVGEPALLNQAFLAIIQNCLDLKLDQLQLLIKTELLADSIRISFKDNGPGIPDQLHSRIFDPFFTTKDVGAGTGMGLTVAQQAVNASGGSITACTPEDGGTEIVIKLPLRGATP
jgi:two-component system, NtrC family, sensor kinase